MLVFELFGTIHHTIKTTFFSYHLMKKKGPLNLNSSQTIMSPDNFNHTYFSIITGYIKS